MLRQRMPKMMMKMARKLRLALLPLPAHQLLLGLLRQNVAYLRANMSARLRPARKPKQKPKRCATLRLVSMSACASSMRL